MMSGNQYQLSSQVCLLVSEVIMGPAVVIYSNLALYVYNVCVCAGGCMFEFASIAWN